MKIVYIIFFLILNFLIFSNLTQKIKLNNKLKISLLIFLLIFCLIHFISNKWISAISNQLFLRLIIFSFCAFIFHYGGKLSKSYAMKIHNIDKNHSAIKGYNFLIHYVSYILIFTAQVGTLINN